MLIRPASFRREVSLVPVPAGAEGSAVRRQQPEGKAGLLLHLSGLSSVITAPLWECSPWRVMHIWGQVVIWESYFLLKFNLKLLLKVVYWKLYN